MVIHHTILALPFGECLLGVTGGKICFLAVVPAHVHHEALDDLTSRWPSALITADAESNCASAVACIDAFLRREPVPDGSLHLEGTPFQLQVWRELRAIPFGAQVSYQEVARRIGRPSACRAVANAIGANPVSLLVPCHRVIRSDGGLGGYRWGVAVKEKILEWERCQIS